VPLQTPTPFTETHALNYHLHAQVASPDATNWWLRPVEPPSAVCEDVVESLVGSMARAVREAGPVVEGALLHVANSIGRLAKTRTERGWPQVSIRYVVEGVGCSRSTARRALSAVSSALLCKRTAKGYLTVVPEAVAACIRLVDRLGAPRPLVHREDWTGEVVEIETPRKRGKTRCPCGHHRRGDEAPSLAYDLRTGLATCQVSRAVYRRDDSGAWSQVRAPFSVRELPRPIARRDTNRYPEGEPADLPWVERLGWGSLLSATLHPGDLRRYEARTGREARSIVEVLRGSARRWCGASEEDKARTCALLGSYRPERLVSLDRSILDYDRTTWRERRDGSWFPTRRVWRRVGTDLVAFDLDALDAAPTDLDESAVERVLGVFDGEMLSPVSIVATSETGMQILARLPGWCPDVERLYLDLRVRRLLRRIGESLLDAVGRAGEVDPSAWHPGRFVRRPGWRVKQGRAVCARLWWTAPE